MKLKYTLPVLFLRIKPEHVLYTEVFLPLDIDTVDTLIWNYI